VNEQDKAEFGNFLPVLGGGEIRKLSGASGFNLKQVQFSGKML
jgi:hypothetical protein